MFIASSSSDSYIKICTLRTGRNIASLRHDSSSIQTLAINSITKTLASGQQDRQLKFWDLQKSKHIRTTPAEANVCYKMMFFNQESNQNNNLLMAAYPEAVKVYDMQRSAALEIVMKPQGYVFDMAISRM